MWTGMKSSISILISPFRLMRAWVDGDLRGFRRGEEDIVVGGVFRVGEFVRGKVAAEVIAATGGDVEGAEDFLVLDVAAGDGQLLGAEAEFAQLAR